jgi:uncharacterized sodium:solute symporter family permease YidK
MPKINLSTTDLVVMAVYLVGIVFFLPFYLKNRIYTLPEFLEGRFEARSRTYLSLLTVIGYLTALLKHAGSNLPDEVRKTFRP